MRSHETMRYRTLCGKRQVAAAGGFGLGRKISRRGAALLLVVIAIVVSTMIVGTLAQMAIAQHRQVRREHERVQTFWLVESGLDRAAARLSRDADYTGEDWRVDVAGRQEPRQGVVTIRITKAADEPRHRLVEVVAEYPAGDVHHTRLRGEQIWSLAAPANSTASTTASAIQPENVVP